jgi:hypothetical protein
MTRRARELLLLALASAPYLTVGGALAWRAATTPDPPEACHVRADGALLCQTELA